MDNDGQLDREEFTVVSCRICVYLKRHCFSRVFLVLNKRSDSPSSRRCISCIVPWKRSPSQLPYPPPSSPLPKGRRSLQVRCQALWPCCPLSPGSLPAWLLSRSPCEALLRWSTLLPSAPALSPSLQNTPSNPAHRYAASLPFLLSGIPPRRKCVCVTSSLFLPQEGNRTVGNAFFGFTPNLVSLIHLLLNCLGMNWSRGILVMQ